MYYFLKDKKNYKGNKSVFKSPHQEISFLNFLLVFFFFNFCPFYQNWGEVHIIFIWDSHAMKSKGLQYLSLDYSILNLEGIFFPH